jgi:hypothetical protein
MFQDSLPLPVDMSFYEAVETLREGVLKEGWVITKEIKTDDGDVVFSIEKKAEGKVSMIDNKPHITIRSNKGTDK